MDRYNLFITPNPTTAVNRFTGPPPYVITLKYSVIYKVELTAMNCVGNSDPLVSNIGVGM